MRNSTLVFTFFVVSANLVNAQSLFSSTTYDSSNSAGSISYSVGQVFYEISNSESNSLNEGLQQPFEISVITGVEENSSIQCYVYPNPTFNILILDVKFQDLEKSSYNLYSVSGVTLERGNVVMDRTQISMSSYCPDTYFLSVLNGSRIVKIFKVIKN